jgi:ABC-type uncharacterized transport system ATPase subunit
VLEIVTDRKATQAAELLPQMLALHRRYRSRTLALRTEPEARVKAEEVLALMHLTEKADSSASELGHGESQRLELGMVLATGASLLLLDDLIDLLLHEGGFGAENLEVASVCVATHEHPEADLVAQHRNSFRWVRFVHLLLQDRRFIIIQGTVHPSR